MFSPAISQLLLVIIVALSILLMLIRPGNIAEVYWIGAGVLLLLGLGLAPVRLAGRAAAQGTNVYLFLVGMMLLSELARTHGVFDWLSSAAVRSAKGSCSRLFVLVYVAGTVVTIFMSNDATAVVLTPAILVSVRKARVEPLPYLFACAFIANAASFVLPISNPANLVVFNRQMPPLGQWLSWFDVPSLLSIVSTYFVLRWIFRKQVSGRIEYQVHNYSLNYAGKLVLGGSAATAVVVLTASALNRDLGLPTCVIAIAVTAIVSFKVRSNPLPLLREISWSTLGLVAGLFVMVDVVESMGAMKLTDAWLERMETLAPASGALITGLFVGIANNLVNNLPLGLIAGGTLQAVHAKALIASAVLIGVDLGPNLSITGCDDFVADRSARGKPKCQFLEFSKGWCHRHARRFAVVDWRRHRNSLVARRSLIGDLRVFYFLWERAPRREHYRTVSVAFRSSNSKRRRLLRSLRVR